MKNQTIVKPGLLAQLSDLKRKGALIGMVAAIALLMGCYGYPGHRGGHRDRDRDHDGDHDGHHGQVDTQTTRDSAAHVFYP